MREKTAVSEVIGYVIILGIVFIVFGLIFFNATALFTDTEETESLQNAQRGFTVLQSNVDEVVFGDSLRRTTQLRLRGGSVAVGGERTRTVLKVDGEVVRNRTLSPIIYESGNGNVSYDNGAVFRGSVTSVGMASEPDWVVRDKLVSVPSVRTFGGGSVGGDGTVSVMTESIGDGFVFSNDSVSTVNVTVTSQNSPAWNRYMQDLKEQDDSFTIDRVTQPSENSVRIDMTLDPDQRFLYTEEPVRVRLR